MTVDELAAITAKLGSLDTEATVGRRAPDARAVDHVLEGSRRPM